MKHQVFFLIILLSLPLMLGCGTSKPAGLPKLYPCKVQIVDMHGIAVEGASIATFFPGIQWVSVGVTDPDGVAELKVNGIYPGIPVGEYNIVVSINGINPGFSDEFVTPLQLIAEAKTNDVTFVVF